MDPSIRKGIQKRRDWIRRHPGGTKEGFPGGALDYIRLDPKDRDKVDALFTSGRKLKANEVSSLVERLTDNRLKRNRIANLRKAALASMRRLQPRRHYKDDTVLKNNKRMTSRELKIAAASTVDEITELARNQSEGNPFWYH